jgi:hypothetical protein
MHLLVKLNNHIIQGLVDTGASTLIIAINVVRELGIMHLVARSNMKILKGGEIWRNLISLDLSSSMKSLNLVMSQQMTIRKTHMK